MSICVTSGVIRLVHVYTHTPTESARPRGHVRTNSQPEAYQRSVRYIFAAWLKHSPRGNPFRVPWATCGTSQRCATSLDSLVRCCVNVFDCICWPYNARVLESVAVRHYHVHVIDGRSTSGPWLQLLAVLDVNTYLRNRSDSQAPPEALLHLLIRPVFFTDDVNDEKSFYRLHCPHGHGRSPVPFPA